MKRLCALLGLLAGCYASPDFSNGSLRCGAEMACPEDYHCALDQTCWKNGQAPSLDAAIGDGAVADGGAAVDAALLQGFVIDPTSFDYGTVFAGSTSPDQTFMVHNETVAATAPLVVTLSGVGAGSFHKDTDGCDGQVLAPHASCAIGVAFAPASAAGAIAALKVDGGNLRTAMAMLTGTGITPPALAISPSNQVFADVVAGASGSDLTFTVSNTGGVPSGTLTTAVSSADFVISAGTDACGGVTLALGESCTLKLHFRPGSAGTKNGMLTVMASPGGNAAAALSGNGLSPAALSIDLSAHDFGPLLVGSATASFTFTVSNTGNAVSGAVLPASLGSGSDFVITADACSTRMLLPGTSCTIAARFQPASPGVKTTTLTVMATPGGSATTTLSGTGQSAASLLAAPPAEDFGSVAVGSSVDADIVISNPGDFATGSLSISLSGGDFSFVSNGCTGVMLAPHASCTIRLRFMPGGSGVRPAGSLQLTGNPGGDVTVALNGRG